MLKFCFSEEMCPALIWLLELKLVSKGGIAFLSRLCGSHVVYMPSFSAANLWGICPGSVVFLDFLHSALCLTAACILRHAECARLML